MRGLSSHPRAVGLVATGAVFIALTTYALGQENQHAAPDDWRSRAHDPGPRPNPPSAIPDPVPGLNPNEAALFLESLLRVSELEGTCDTCAQQPQNGLPIDPDPQNPFSPLKLVNSAGMGPVFNADQCFICHFQPQIGGSSPRINPAQVIAHRLGGTNTVPAFEAPGGVFREVRFKFNPDGTRDGGVHSLFTLQGRSDAPECTLRQPDFNGELSRRNIAFRIPLQLFGLGLIEAIQDKSIRANMNANAAAKRGLGTRLFLLHDGRTSDLLVAIRDHYSAPHSEGGDNPERDSHSSSYRASEANAVIERFATLEDTEKQAILDFLRDL